MILPTAIINLKNLRNNIKYIKSICGSSLLYPVVKANAYGHGINRISKFLNAESIEGVCVATINEIIDIIKLDLDMNIFHLGKVILNEDRLFDDRIIFTINSMDDIPYVEKACSQYNKKIRCHIKVDTGMNRMGCKESDFIRILDKCSESQYIILEGIYSHLCHADDVNSLKNNKQINLFEKIIKQSNKYHVKYHILNSAGVFNFSKSKLDLVRCGLSLYGISPLNSINSNLSPVMELKAPVILIKNINKNETVGYGCTYKADKPQKIAIVQCGYADGIPANFGNKAYVYYNKYKFPIIGRVSMDLICINISDLDDSEMLDEVTIWGGYQESSRLELISKKFDTIPYVYLTNLSNRVKRVYIEN